MSYVNKKDKVRDLRKNSTKAEKLLWEALRNNSLGFKFRRQYPADKFILDFYCYELKLAIELDGSVHTDKFQKDYDKIRTEKLKELGITVIRFWNNEIEKDLKNVLEKIKYTIKYLT